MTQSSTTRKKVSLKKHTPKATSQTESKQSIQPKSKLKRLLLWLRLPGYVRYLLKLIIALIGEILLIQVSTDLTTLLTKQGLASLSGYSQADASIAANIVNQQLNLMTSVSALLIAASILVFVWTLIIKPTTRSYRKLLNWLSDQPT